MVVMSLIIDLPQIYLPIYNEVMSVASCGRITREHMEEMFLKSTIDDQPVIKNKKQFTYNRSKGMVTIRVCPQVQTFDIIYKHCMSKTTFISTYQKCKL